MLFSKLKPGFRGRPPAQVLKLYQPAHTERGLFSLHIPKTAGSYLNDVMEHWLGPEVCDPFLIRGRKAFDRNAGTVQADYMAHHVSLNAVERAGLKDRYDVITLIRDPMDRLVSHLNWADRYNHGKARLEHLRMDARHKALVAQIRRTDPDSPRSLQALFRLDSLMKANWFYNSQLANLFLREHGDLLAFLDLETLRKPAIRAGLSRVAICTTLPQLLEGLSAAGFEAPHRKTVNKNPTARFTRSPALEAAAERFVALDQRLFDVVTTQVPDVSPLARVIQQAQIRRAALQPV